MMALNKDVVREFVRFALVGLFNTAVGYGVFLICYGVIGLSPFLANAIGYFMALSAAYFLYKSFVFKAQVQSGNRIASYIVCFAIAFALNQLVLFGMMKLVPAHFAQIFAMVSYTIAFYGLNKFVTFRASDM